MAFHDKPLNEMLPDGRRMILRQGPIDLIIEATGSSQEVKMAYQQAVAAFENILRNLVDEIDYLRMPITRLNDRLTGTIAKSMATAASSVSNGTFVTPMIAVAGSVADHVLKQMVIGRHLNKAYVNNGGDIALHLSSGESFDVGICSNPSSGSLNASTRINCASNVRGVATSGWRGRSHSLGIADAITVLAQNAATADAAATLIANAVDLPAHPAITRKAANELSPDSDLGEQLVTIDVGQLSRHDVARALNAGKKLSQKMIGAGQITAVYGNLQNQSFALDGMTPSTALKSSGAEKLLEAAHA